MDGFFPESEAVERVPLFLLPQCGRCGLHKTCKTPFMPYHGKGKMKTLVVGESPGKDEDFRGRPFVGKTGQRLRQELRKIGVDLTEDCWATNALVCRPPNNKVEKEVMVDWCRPNLTKTIRELKPERVILLGAKAIRSLIGAVWKEGVGPVRKWAGFVIPCRDPNAWVCPTFHPSYVVREEEKNPAATLWWNRHLEAAFRTAGRPWDSKELKFDATKEVRTVYDVGEAEELLARFAASERRVAFDYETTTLKPDGPEAEIVCVGLSDGRLTAAFPWRRRLGGPMRRFLRSPVRKVAANMKFETRWSAAKLGVVPRNMEVDTMILAHVLDNRSGITGLKFQAFVRLGQASYDDAVKPFLEGKTPNGRNRIHEVSIDRLLCYCGADALLEWRLAGLMANKEE